MLEWTPRKAMVFQAAGTIAAPFAIYHMEAFWLALALAFWLLQNLVTTVALHRLFVHAAFECNRAWHIILGALSCLAMTSSPMQWAVAHYTHHRFSDTDRDPHNNKWAKRFGVVCLTRQDYDFSGARRLMRDPLHRFLHSRYFAVHCVWIALWYVIGDWQAVCAAWMLPALGSMWIGAHHTAFAHKDGKPTNLSWPFGLVYFGEHLHEEHHDKPRLVNYATQRGQLDIGHLFIRLVAKKSSQAASKKQSPVTSKQKLSKLLVPDWKRVLRRAWSIRLMLLAGLLSGLEAILPIVMDVLPWPRWVASTVISLVVGLAFVTRLMAQKDD